MFYSKTIIPIIFGLMILTGSTGIQLTNAFAQTSVEGSEGPSNHVVGYFPWYRAQHIDSIDYEKVTHINYFSIETDTIGNLITNDINIDDMHSIRDNAHSAGATISISVGGWERSAGFSSMAANNDTRSYFAQNIAQFISTHNLDGVDIDWEPVETVADMDNYSELIQKLREDLPSDKLVTVAVNAERMELRPDAIPALSWVNVMAYDMNWDNAEHSTYDDALAALTLYENADVPKDKLVLGVPFYGRDANWKNEIMYSQAVSDCNLTPADNYCNGYFFNGIDLITQKSQYVLDNGYGGIMFWEHGQDTFDETSLLNAIDLVFGTNTTQPNNPPTAVDDSTSVSEGQTMTINVAANDYDNDGTLDLSSITIVQDPFNAASLVNNDDGTLTYTHDGSATVSDSFMYTINDDDDATSNHATVSISITQLHKLHIHDILGASGDGKRWTGTATIIVYDNSEIAYSGATVSGTWQDNRISSCVTDLQGQCQLSKKTRADSIAFTVNDVSASGTIYDQNANENGNSITIVKGGNANQLPNADTGGPYSGILGNSIIFDGSTSEDYNGTITNYDWDFGDGNTGSGEKPSHTYTAIGTYDVILTVTDNEGATNSASTLAEISSTSTENLTIEELSPPSMTRGVQAHIVIYGIGFDETTTITFSGDKWRPSVENIQHISSTQIEIDVIRSSAGPSKAFRYDVTATNSNGDSHTVIDAFEVN